MLNSLEAAVATLEDAGALVYEISQPGSFKQKGEATDTQTLIDKFLGDWEKLVQGIYKVDYAKTASDKRSGLCFRISKTASAYGSPAQLAGIDTDRIGALQQQITNLETERRIEAIQAQHRDELRALEAKHEKGSSGFGGIDGPTFLAGLDKMQTLFNSVTNRSSAAVSGPAQLPAAPQLGTAEEAVASALGTLQSVLGDQALSEALSKLASKGQTDPDGLRKALGYIDLL